MTVIRETLERYAGQTVGDLNLLPEGTPAQLIEGEIIMSPSPVLLHQHVLARLFFELRAHVTTADLGHVWPAPLDVHLSERDVFQPDLIYASHERAAEIMGEFIHGAPDLVVEILSPSTGYYDLTKKRDAYERYGVLEYWIADPQRKHLEILVQDDGEYRTHQELDETGTARSKLLEGFEIDMVTLFATW